MVQGRPGDDSTASMLIFETILVLLFVAALLSLFARAVGIPYPVLLALGGIALAQFHALPTLNLPPDLILALFVAPVLLDAAHDTSLRDLRQNWKPVLSLVVAAVGLTTLAVAGAARWFLPDMPWAAAIALGALLAPPDAVAALAVLSQMRPPHRIRAVLEGESLLNDASSLLIYKLALTSVAAGAFHFSSAIPAFVLVVFGSALAGWALAHIIIRLTARISDPPTATIIQFVTTFGVWIVAEKLQLSAVVTVVVLGITAGRRTTISEGANVRVSSFATWETVTFVLNVLVFTLIGLQLRPIVNALKPAECWRYLAFSVIILAIVILVRLVWVLLYKGLARMSSSVHAPRGESFKSAVVVGWAGMRGIVTLAAALALPQQFPYRNFILLAAYTVVLGTLIVQGLTLRPLMSLLRLPEDDPIAGEVQLARKMALKAAMHALDQESDPAAERLKTEYRGALSEAREGRDPHDSRENSLRREVVPHSRRAIADLRKDGKIGDEAYRQVEAELDWLELSAQT